MDGWVPACMHACMYVYYTYVMHNNIIHYKYKVTLSRCTEYKYTNGAAGKRDFKLRGCLWSCGQRAD